MKQFINILVYNSNQMRKSQRLFYLTVALHVSGVAIAHPQEHKATVTTALYTWFSVHHFLIRFISLPT